MSLINQMLNDLQQQKAAGGAAKPEVRRRSVMAKIPYLPLPLVLGGATLVLVLVVWWLSGALSDLMFGVEPADKPAGHEQLAANEPPATATQTMPAAAEPDQLTMAEREAEPPATPAAPAPAAAAVAGPGAVFAAPVRPAVQAPAAKPLAEKAEPGLSPVLSSKPKTAPKQVADAASPTRSLPAAAPHKAVAASKRLHPDDLPGAVSSSKRLQPEARVPARPSASPATTPYGMAEEAFLDGKWALEQHRANLAVKSLQQALEFYPGHLPARELLVEILGKDGKHGEAMFLLAEGLEIAPDYIAFKKAYARMLAEQGDYDTAIRVMLSGELPSAAADPEAYVVLATLYQRLGEPFLTAQTYRNLLVEWPQTGAFWVGLGSALEAQNLPKDAVECYRRALATKNLRQDLSLYAEKRLQQLH